MQWGDEGKGKIVDLLTPSVDVVVRFQGGANAGHTVIVGGEKTILHLLPTGILHSDCLCIIANGVVVDPDTLVEEIDMLNGKGMMGNPNRLAVSWNANLVMPYHRLIDRLREEQSGSVCIGTTGRGIGPCYEDKVGRLGVRAFDLTDIDIMSDRLNQVLPIKNRQIEMLGGSPMNHDDLIETAKSWSQRLIAHIVNAEKLLHDELRAGKRILFEGAQGTMLDIDHGTYPFVTSSSTIAGGACSGAGFGPTMVDGVLGITKAYTTRVGNGPFPTELSDEMGSYLRDAGGEFGATTGRLRRCGWLDLVVAKYAARLSGITHLAVTKLDVLSGIEKLKVCTGYRMGGRVIDEIPSSVSFFEGIEPVYEEIAGWSGDITSVRKYDDLPGPAKEYLKLISDSVGVKISIISVGPERDAHIMLLNPVTSNQ